MKYISTFFTNCLLTYAVSSIVHVRQLQSSVWRCSSAIQRSADAPDTKEQSKQCISPDARDPKKVRFTRWDLHRLPGAAQTGQRAPLLNYWVHWMPNCRKNGPIRRHHGQISRIRLRTATPSTVFSKFDLVRLPCVSKLEKITRPAVWVEWGGHLRHRGQLEKNRFFFRRVKKDQASLGQVYRAKRRLIFTAPIKKNARLSCDSAILCFIFFIYGS